MDGLVDFDLWIKLATDNKINAKNSWTVALIDYFSDLTYLKEGQSINFQKASATLDGCVKIYASRVDSVVLETGKLLSGLSHDVVEEPEESENEEEKPNRRYNQVVETTLVKNFDNLRARGKHTEAAFDPMFKKVLNDFDEGGAKSLLLNMLTLDGDGRVQLGDRLQRDDTAAPEAPTRGIRKSRWRRLRQMALPGDDPGDEAVLSPALTLLQDVVYTNKSTEELAKVGRDEAVADDILQDLSYSDYQSMTEPEPLVSEPLPDSNLIAYFDAAYTASAPVQEHWRIQNLKRRHGDPTPRVPKPSRREPVEIDFFEVTRDDDDAALFASARPYAHLRQDKARRTAAAANHHRLVDTDIDIHRLTGFFLVPDRKVHKFKRVKPRKDTFQYEALPPDVDHDPDEKHRDTNRRIDDIVREELDELHETYDDTFFRDDEPPVDDSFVDPVTGNLTIQGYGLQLVATGPRLQSTYINFTRTTRKVDVQLLKANMWLIICNEDAMMFSDVFEHLRNLYGDAIDDISTSYGFICLLHLINEKGFLVEEMDGDLMVCTSIHP